MTVEESINLQVLHWATPQGKVPLSGDDSWCRLRFLVYAQIEKEFLAVIFDLEKFDTRVMDVRCKYSTRISH